MEYLILWKKQIDAAYKAQKEFSNYSLEEREKLIAAMRKAILDSAMNIATCALMNLKWVELITNI
jgi:acyl-CoA reductase-like NAD-dependent aldehyde dehydrogenase